MKKDWIWLVGLSLCIIFVIPWSVGRWHKEKEITGDEQIRVMLSDKEVVKLPLEEYLVGVVAAEMPAEFELEALKAQAIAARTYAAKRISQSSQQKYDVDTTVQTQAWIPATEMRKRWGWLNYLRYQRKIQKAVQGTRGLVLVYNGELIEAFYHSSSGRKPTERSEEVWSSARAYLQNVSSGEENLNRYIKEYVYSPQELYKKLGLKEAPRALNSEDFKLLGRTLAGRAKSVQVLGKVYPANQLRTMLGLCSTDIEYTIQAQKLTITAYGNGHAVGMSQWGANDLAKNNNKAEDILAHFYPGAKLLTIGNT